jgi:hypothetical protein
MAPVSPNGSEHAQRIWSENEKAFLLQN